MRFRITVDVVRDEDGTPIGGALVQLVVADEALQSAAGAVIERADSAGRCVLEAELPEGASTHGVLFARARGRGANREALEAPLDLSVAEHHRVVRLPKGRTYGGVVTDEQGAPIEGAVVDVVLLDDGGTMSGSRGGFVQGVFDGKARFRCGMLERRRTDAKGAFELLDVVELSRGLSDRMLLLNVDHPNYVSACIRGIERWAPETAADLATPPEDPGHVDVPVRLRRGFDVSGTVTDETGQPLQGVEVSARFPSDRARPWGATSSKEVHTDAAGRFVIRGLEPRDHGVVFAAVGFTAEHHTILPGSAASGSIVVRVQRGRCVRGIAIGKDGKPERNAYLYLSADSEGRIARTRSDAEGRFEFAGLPANLDGAIVHLYGWPAIAITDESEIVVQVPRTNRVRIVLTDVLTRGPARGLPHRAGTVRRHGSLVQGSSSRLIRFDDAGGAIAEVLPLGSVTVEVHVPGYLRKQIELDAASLDPDRPLEVMLEPGATVDGELIAADGEPLKRAWIRFRDQNSRSPETTLSDESGRFSMPGTHRDGVLVIEHRDHAMVVLPMEHAPPPVDGRVPLRLRMERGATIVGRVVRKDGSPAVGEIVALEWPEGETSVTLPWAVVQRDGSYRIEHVPAYRVMLRARDDAREVALADGESFVADFGLPE